MDDPLATYLNDHLAGARFAIALLERLRDAYPDASHRQFATTLLGEIEADRLVLQNLADQVGGDTNAFKEATAWLAEKASRVKLRLGSGDELALYEALETLSLGILGKLKLWQALATVADGQPWLKRLDLNELAERAKSQHEGVETRRLAAARSLFGEKCC
jgi:hypothetical protein